jgi:hypothetical protein
LLHNNLTKCGNDTRIINCNCYDKHRWNNLQECN